MALTNEANPEVCLTSNGDGTFTLVIGHQITNNITLDEALAVISGYEVNNGREVLS